MIGFFADTIRDGAAAPDWRDQLAGWLLVLIVVVFFGFTIFRGIREALLASLIALLVVVTVDALLVYSIAGEVRFLNAVWLVGLLVLSGLAALAGIPGRIVGGGFGAWAIGVSLCLGALLQAEHTAGSPQSS